MTTPEASSGSKPSSEPVAAQNLTDANHDDDGVASLVKPIAGGRHLIKGRPSGKAPDNAMPHRVEDSNKVLGETFEPDTLECENCGEYNDPQLVFCRICAKSLANTDTTSAQKEQLIGKIIESPRTHLAFVSDEKEKEEEKKFDNIRHSYSQTNHSAWSCQINDHQSLVPGLIEFRERA